MGYLFGAGVTDKITTPTLTAWTTTMSVMVRIRPTQAVGSTQRDFFNLADGSGFFQFFFGFNSAVPANQIQFGYQDTVPAFPLVAWTSGFAAGSLHTVVGVIDTTLGSQNLKLYADVDATPKVTGNSATAPHSTTNPTGLIGNNPSTTTLCADGVIYEIAYWPQVALTAAQAVFLGAGYDAAYLFAPFQWRLRTNANARRGGAHGTVTGATVVAHTPVIAPPEALGQVA